jgi:hypothetical protein
MKQTSKVSFVNENPMTSKNGYKELPKQDDRLLTSLQPTATNYFEEGGSGTPKGTHGVP